MVLINKKHIFLKLIIVFVIIVPGLLVLARYLYKNGYDRYFKSKEFYFYSDILTFSNEEYNISNWDGLSYNLNIDVNNKLNDATWTKYDIDYDVVVDCPDNIVCEINSGSSDTLIYLYDKVSVNNIDISIKSSEFNFKKGDNFSVIVKVKSKGSYKKELSATFNFEVSNYGLIYQINDEINSKYFIYQFSNSLNETKNVTLSFDNNLVRIDTTNDIVLNAINNGNYTLDNGYVNSVTFDIGSKIENIIYFYKNDLAVDYSYPIINDNSVIRIVENS